MSLFGLLLGSPIVRDLAVSAGKAAGRWVAEKVVAATDAAIAKARQLADAVDRAAREKVRSAIHEGADSASNKVGQLSQGYQNAKSAVMASTKKIGEAVDAVKELFGMEPPEKSAENCPLTGTLNEAPDGALTVPTDTCPADAIPVGKGGVQAAMAKAKAASVGSNRKCCASKPASERNRTIIYVNGILTSPKAHCETLRKLRDMTCGKVIGVLNKSENPTDEKATGVKKLAGAIVAGVIDVVRTNDARMRIKQEIGGGPAMQDYAGFTPAVKTMKDVLTLQAASGEPTTVFAHSEGVAITSLATIRAKQTLKNGGMHDAMGELDIVTMGGAAPALPDGPNYTHYIHEQDIVPNTVGLGDSAEQNVIHFGGRNGDYHESGADAKRPYVPINDLLNPFGDHFADSSYLPYINKKTGGCLNKAKDEP